MPRMKPRTAIARARSVLRLLERDGCWYVMRGDSGTGRTTEAEGRDYYEQSVMFEALRLLDPHHDWHAYDWHTLVGCGATDRVARMLMWRQECDAATAELAPVRALVGAMVRAS